ncbi:MAG TPA: sugar ABC transporter substrate-binding protein [Chloroflexota bacterium]|nr:sugar ABC transporter substrate-binding protein [Chloroflexota bacterium]
MQRFRRGIIADQPAPRRAVLRLAGAITVALPLLAACGAAAGVQGATSSAATSSAAASSAATTTNASAAGTTSSANSSVATSSATSASATAVAAAGSKLLFGTWTDNDQDKLLFQGMLDNFNKAHPQTQFGYLPVPGGTSKFLEKLSTLLAGGTPPDAFNMYYPWVVSLGDQGVFQTLDSYISTGKVDMSDFYPNALNAFKYQGKQIGMPFYAGPSVCYLNKTAFDKAGVPLPANDWTWDDLVSTAQKLTQTGGGSARFGLAPISTGLNWVNAFIWENGGNEFSDDLTTSRLAEATSVGAFQYELDLITKQHVAPTPAEMKGKSTADMFHSGEVAMVVNTCRCGVPLYGTWTDVQLSSVALPKGKTGQVSRDGPNAISVSSASKQLDAAWQLADYFASPEGQTAFLATHRSVPTRQSFLNSAAFKNSLLPWENIEVYKLGMQTVKAGQYPKNWVQINDAVQKAVNGARDGKTSVSSALQAANTQVNSLLKG